MMENAGLAACALMNRQRESGAFVLAVDLPSGISTPIRVRPPREPSAQT